MLQPATGGMFDSPPAKRQHQLLASLSQAPRASVVVSKAVTKYRRTVRHRGLKDMPGHV
jgi:hypothetical protein